MREHTKGPWHWYDSATRLSLAGEQDGHVILSIWHECEENKTPLDNPADVRLMATAPDLLLALLPFAALLQRHHEPHDDDYPVFGINNVVITVGDLRRAVAAIKRAKGEQP